MATTRPPARANLTVGAIIAGAILVTALGNAPSAAQLAPTQQPIPERVPGPIIEDPPGPYRGQMYVRAPENVPVLPGNALSTFIVTYNGFTPEAQAAFQAAVNIWASQVQSSVPIRITANWTALGPGILGSAGPKVLLRNFAGAPNATTWYPVAVANKLSGTDLDPTNDDITANFSSSFDWYFGTDGNAGTKFDLMSVVLHELGHGLGFIGSMNVSSQGSGSWGASGFPFAYDLYAVNGASQSLINTSIFPNPSAALAAQLVSDSVFFNGPNARNANAGVSPKLYAPNPWVTGSSYSHLDEAAYPAGSVNSLMTYALGPGEAIHDPGPIVRGIFADTGWGSCLYSLSSSSHGAGAKPATSSVSVAANGGCGWTATSNASWLTITGGSSGNGPGTVNFAVAANSGGSRTGTLTIAGQPFTVAQSAHEAESGDFDADNRSDIVVFRPANGTWYLRDSSGPTVGIQWGNSLDIPVPGDYDGDGKIDVAIFRPSNGTWYIINSSTGLATGVQWGNGSDVAVPGDYDGDGKTDVAVFRPSNGTWYIVNSSTGVATGLQWGNGSDVAVPGDYDGDGRTDIAVFRPSTGTWYIVNSSTGIATGFQWGNGSDVTVPGDYDGDGRTDIAVFRPSTGTWYIVNSSTGVATGFQWGNGSDVPVPGDYDGDGKTDIAVFRPSNGTWYIVNSSTGTPVGIQWGNGADIPILKRP